MSVPAHVPHIGTPLAICNRKINSNFQENKQSGDYFCNFFWKLVNRRRWGKRLLKISEP